MSEEDLLRHYATQDMAWRVARLERIVSNLQERYRTIDVGWGTRLNDMRKRLDAQFAALAEKLRTDGPQSH